MPGDIEKTKYYLIGKEDKIYGYSMCKLDAELICAQRKDYRYKRFKHKKAKDILDHYSTLSEVVRVCGTNICMFLSEEECFLESFTQYHWDAMKNFTNILERLKFLKYEDDEVEPISLIIREMHEYNEGMGRGTLYDTEEEFVNQFWDYGEAAKWYIENVLKDKIREEYMK